MYFRAMLCLGLLGLLGLTPLTRSADERKAVAKCVTETGTILRREAPGQAWKLVADKEALYTGDLLLAGTDAALVTDNGAVKLMLVGGAGGTGPLPIIETAVVLNSSADADLDFTFLRGRVDLVNQKEKGEAKVRIRGPEGAVEVRLVTPQTRLALVLYGRWLPGVPFRKDAKPEEYKPAQAIIALVMQGEVEIQTPKHRFHMNAPPGPALLEGDHVGRTDPSPRRLEALPDWATEKANTEDAKKIRAALARFRELAKQKSIPEAIDQMLQSETLAERMVAVGLMGATDDLERLGMALSSAKTPDVWENGIRVIRHWIGREPGQDMKVYQALQEKKKLTPVQAETVLQLLHNFSDDALTRPETYESLLDQMESDQLPIRGLAHWHLYRLVPPGRKIGFDPTASAEQRAKSVAEWRKLIPVGKLPPTK